MRPIGSNTLAMLLSKTRFIRKGISNSSWRDNISSKLIVSVSLFESHIVPKIFPVVSLSLSTRELSKLVSYVRSSLIKTGSGETTVSFCLIMLISSRLFVCHFLMFMLACNMRPFTFAYSSYPSSTLELPEFKSSAYKLFKIL